MKKITPILFSQSMVKALLAGHKTQTRRIITDQHILTYLDEVERIALHGTNSPAIQWPIDQVKFKKPYGVPGSLLWVRESFIKIPLKGEGNPPYYVAFPDLIPEAARRGIALSPSIYLKRDKARFWLENTELRIERLQNISEADAIAEGIAQSDHYIDGWKCYLCDKNGHRGDMLDGLCEDGLFKTAVESFRSLWELINNPGSWQANPWVWVICFKELSRKGMPEIAELEGALP
jgi:hypothetical protein